MSKILSVVHQCIEILFPPRKTETLVRMTPSRRYAELVRPRLIEDTEALLPYHDPRVSALIWELKYKDSDIAARIAGKVLAEHLVSVLAEEMVHYALLIPIPLHPTREKERGYNQSERIAREVLPFLHGHTTLAPNALRRVENTPRQTTLGRTMRLRNVAGAFEATPELVRGETCILIDDVVTTGATLAEAKKTLLRAGASRVICVALAYA